MLKCCVALVLFASSLPGVAVASDGSLDACVDRAIVKTRERTLRGDRHTPWVVMHAVIAFGLETRIQNADSAQGIEAVEHLLTRATFDGRRIFRDADGEPALPTRSLSYGLREPHLIQDHVDQFLMAFGLAGVALERKLVAHGGHEFTVRDMLVASQRNFRPEQELAMTLVSMSAYLGAGESWTNARGGEYRVEDLVALAIRRDPRSETEGGPHHLFGVAYALEKHGTDGPVWVAAKAYLQEYVRIAREWQQADGAFSGGVFRRNSAPRSSGHLVSTTGHTLEWLVPALGAEESNAPWVRGAVRRLCATMNEQPIEAFSDGGLYHAAHALQIYRDAIQEGDNR